MRLLRLLWLLACIALGATLGGLNSQPVVVDVGIGIVPLHLGEALLVALLLGVLLGGAAMWPARRKPKAPPVLPPPAPAATPPAAAADDEE
jgi:hypothetical protein